MTDKELIQAVLSTSVETGSLVCLGCGHEHGCGIHGCAIAPVDVAIPLRGGVSGYRSVLYDEALMDWRRFSTTSRTTSGEEAEECVWINYEPPYRQMTMEGVGNA